MPAPALHDGSRDRLKKYSSIELTGRGAGGQTGHEALVLVLALGSESFHDGSVLHQQPRSELSDHDAGRVGVAGEGSRA